LGLNKLSEALRANILQSLCDGSTQRECERRYEVSNKTIQKLLRDAGDMAIEYLATTTGLKASNLQADELWSFVKAKQKNVGRLKKPSADAGTVWTYLAICADTKFAVAYHLGDRKLPDATKFVANLRTKLAQDEDGRLSKKTIFITDGLSSYVEAGEEVFGDEVDRAMLVKQYSNLADDGQPTPASRYTGVEKRRLAGQADMKSIHTSYIIHHTSYIERLNLTLRTGNRRYARKTIAFSKTLLNHERQLALWLMYYNLCLLPSPQRKARRDSSEEYTGKRCTPAMEIGHTDHLWKVVDIVRLTDKYTARIKLENAGTGVVIRDQKVAEYWVYASNRHEAKVHHRNCSRCNDGKGLQNGRGSAGDWIPATTFDEAVHLAKQRQPGRNSICGICIGSYRTSGYRGPRGAGRRSVKLLT
jgi:hypothetical protein